MLKALHEEFSVSGAAARETILYLFPEAPLAALSPSTVSALTALHQSLPEAEDLATLALLFTYLGQFVDHDLTAFPPGVLMQVEDPRFCAEPASSAALCEAREPRAGAFSLAALYQEAPRCEEDPACLRAKPEAAQPGACFFVGELKLAFLRFHNLSVRAWPHPRQKGDAEKRFAAARANVHRLYAWLVLHAYLPGKSDPAQLRCALRRGPLLSHQIGLGPDFGDLSLSAAEPAQA